MKKFELEQRLIDFAVLTLESPKSSLTRREVIILAGQLTIWNCPCIAIWRGVGSGIAKGFYS